MLVLQESLEDLSRVKDNKDFHTQSASHSIQIEDSRSPDRMSLSRVAGSLNAVVSESDDRAGKHFRVAPIQVPQKKIGSQPHVSSTPQNHGNYSLLL